MKEIYGTNVVRKGYADSISALRDLPRYVSEHLISLHADEGGLLPQDAIEAIQADLIKYCPDKREKEAFKSRAMELGRIPIIDHYEVYTDLRTGKYRTKILCIDEKATVDREIVKPNRYPGLLRGGLWGKAIFDYVKRGDGAVRVPPNTGSLAPLGQAVSTAVGFGKEGAENRWGASSV
ncbi:MAG: anti-phage BREX system Lon protease BrxL, partial [Promethearchaeota archaeon]